MIWFSFLPMTPSYSSYAPNIWNSWDSWDYKPLGRKDKWATGFLTNCDNKDLDTYRTRYEKAAKAVGAKIRVEEKAYDIHGRIISRYVAIYIDNPEKRSSFWGALKDVAKTPETTSFVIERKAELILPKLPKLCDCNMTLLMRSGCKCKGI